MQRASAECPSCGQLLAISWDMWGSYYLCRDCGYTAEDDDELSSSSPRGSSIADAPRVRTQKLHEPASRR